MPADDDGLTPVTENDLLLGPVFTRSDDYAEPIEEPSGPDNTSQFDRRYRDPFLGLLFLGKLTEEVTIYGHSFSLETPTQNERLESGIIHKKYMNSISSEIAWAALTVATYLRQVDGSDLPQPIGPVDTGVRDRFEWVIDNLKGAVINKIFEYCLTLDLQVTTALDELERLGES